MLILGDVLAIVAGLLGVFLSAWALTVTCGLLFAERTEAARAGLEARPWRALGIGALLTGTVGLLSVILLSQPFPVVKLMGWAVFLSLLSVAAIGAAGTALLAGERMQRMAPELSAFVAFARGAGVIVGGCLLPLLGWFAFAPLLFVASLGAGWMALVSSRRRAEAA